MKIEMKKNASVLILAVRSCFYKCLGVMALTVAAEFVLFAVSALRQGIPSLEKVFTGSGIPLMAGIGALIILFLLTVPWSPQKKSRPILMVWRLGISNKAAVIIITAYNFCIFIIFWAFEILAALLMSAVFLGMTDASNAIQIIYLAFFRVGFLHSLLPLSDLLMLLRVILNIFVLALSAATEVFSHERFLNRRFSAWFYIYFTAVLILSDWCELPGDIFSVITSMVFALCMATVWICQIIVSFKSKDEPGEKFLEKKERRPRRKKGAAA